MSWDKSKPAKFVRVLNYVQPISVQKAIAEGLSIRSATPRDEQAFKSASSLFALPPVRGPKAGDALAEVTTVPGELSDSRKAVDSAFRRLILALRILKDGAVSTSEQLIKQSGGYHVREMVLPSLGGDWGFFGPQYVLLNDDMTTLVGLYAGLDKVEARVQPAVHRFDLGCGRSDRNDRLIDWWVALESLFGDRQGEITYKLSLRIAYFIAASSERPELARALRKAYAARSAVVHGQQPKDLKMHEDATVAALRRSLQRLILAGRSVDVEKLDDVIASGGSTDSELA